MTNHYAQDHHYRLANSALSHLLKNTPMPITLRDGKQPKGFPLPIKRVRGEGDITQEYRPLAILDYVQDVVNAEALAHEAEEKAKAEDQEAT